jgi:pSer/pThr/pTyr-binding forkhead associated (FHA) protein
MSYRLISPDGTQSYDLKMHVPLIIGRAPTCDLPVFDPTISRRHAELVCDEDTVALRDLGSSNGTFVNGAKVMEATLQVDDLVAFGKVAFRLESFVPATPPMPMSMVPSAPLGSTIVRQMPMRDSRAALASLNAPATAPGGLSRAVVSPLSAPPSDKSQQKLATLLEVSKGLTRAVDVDTILNKIGAYAYQTLEVDRVAILLLDERGELVPKIARDKRGGDTPRASSARPKGSSWVATRCRWPCCSATSAASRRCRSR